MKTRFSLCAVVMVLGLVAADARADGRRVAVLEFEGAKADEWQKAVTGLIGRRHDVVPARTFQKTARRLRARDLSERNVARVSSALDIDGVIEGYVEREDGRYVLRLRLREGATGKTVRKFTLRMSSPRFKSKTKRQLTEKLDAAIVDLPPLDEVPPGVDEDDWDVDDEDEDDFEEEAPSDREEVRSRRDDEDPTEVRAERAERDASDDRDDVPRKGGREFRSRAMLVSVGASAVGRNLSFTSAEYLADASPAGYKGPLVPSLLVSAELYPLAFDASRKGGAAGVGVGFVYEKAAPFETQLSGAMDITMPTTYQRWGVSARYRHLFGSKPTSPSMVISAGYNKMEFTFDQSQVPMNIIVDIPNVAYTYYDPGLAFRLPVGVSAALTAEGKFLLVTTAGEITNADQYGTAKITGFDVDVGLEYRVGANLMVRLAGRYAAMGYAFDGSGEETNNRDGAPDTQDVGGALDKYVGGYLSAGYMF